MMPHMGSRLHGSLVGVTKRTGLLGRDGNDNEVEVRDFRSRGARVKRKGQGGFVFGFLTQEVKVHRLIN
jgi:hypothetical protein